MGIVVATGSLSLDGYSAGPDTSPDAPLGVGGERLHHWLFPDSAGADARPTADDEAVAAAQHARTGAVIVGRRTYDVGAPLWGDTPFPVPTFVVTHRAQAPREMASAAFTFVADGLTSALDQARAAAGGRDVLVMGGASIVRQYLAAGLVDELVLNLVPVLLHRGERLLDVPDGPTTELVRTGLVATPAATHLTYRVVR